jgi:hypothetical protein
MSMTKAQMAEMIAKLQAQVEVAPAAPAAPAEVSNANPVSTNMDNVKPIIAKIGDTMAAWTKATGERSTLGKTLRDLTREAFEASGNAEYVAKAVSAIAAQHVLQYRELNKQPTTKGDKNGTDEQKAAKIEWDRWYAGVVACGSGALRTVNEFLVPKGWKANVSIKGEATAEPVAASTDDPAAQEKARLDRAIAAVEKVNTVSKGVVVPGSEAQALALVRAMRAAGITTAMLTAAVANT